MVYHSSPGHATGRYLEKPSQYIYATLAEKLTCDWTLLNRIGNRIHIIPLRETAHYHVPIKDLNTVNVSILFTDRFLLKLVFSSKGKSRGNLLLFGSVCVHIAINIRLLGCRTRIKSRWNLLHDGFWHVRRVRWFIVSHVLWKYLYPYRLRGRQLITNSENYPC